jgi:sec-independent protein translocase protein TatC
MFYQSELFSFYKIMLKYFIECKNRLLLVLFSMFMTFIFSYVYKEILLFILLSPNYVFNFDVIYFIFTDLTEVFTLYLKLIMFFLMHTFILSFMFQCFVFFSSALFISEYKFLLRLLKISFIIWILTILVTNFLIIPSTWYCFFYAHDFISQKFVPLYFEAKLTTYFNFYLSVYYTCVLVFQFTLGVFMFINYYSNNLKQIKKLRKIYYYFFVLVSTLLTPPDIFSQCIISFLFILGYELFIIGFVIYKILIR